MPTKKDNAPWRGSGDVRVMSTGNGKGSKRRPTLYVMPCNGVHHFVKGVCLRCNEHEHNDGEQ